MDLDKLARAAGLVHVHLLCAQRHVLGHTAPAAGTWEAPPPKYRCTDLGAPYSIKLLMSTTHIVNTCN